MSSSEGSSEGRHHQRLIRLPSRSSIGYKQSGSAIRFPQIAQIRFLCLLNQSVFPLRHSPRSADS